MITMGDLYQPFSGAMHGREATWDDMGVDEFTPQKIYRYLGISRMDQEDLGDRVINSQFSEYSYCETKPNGRSFLGAQTNLFPSRSCFD